MVRSLDAHSGVFTLASREHIFQTCTYIWRRTRETMEPLGLPRGLRCLMWCIPHFHSLLRLCVCFFKCGFGFGWDASRGNTWNISHIYIQTRDMEIRFSGPRDWWKSWGSSVGLWFCYIQWRLQVTRSLVRIVCVRNWYCCPGGGISFVLRTGAPAILWHSGKFIKESVRQKVAKNNPNEVGPNIQIQSRSHTLLAHTMS